MSAPRGTRTRIVTCRGCGTRRRVAEHNGAVCYDCRARKPAGKPDPKDAPARPYYVHKTDRRLETRACAGCGFAFKTWNDSPPSLACRTCRKRQRVQFGNFVTWRRRALLPLRILAHLTDNPELRSEAEALIAEALKLDPRAKLDMEAP